MTSRGLGSIGTRTHRTTIGSNWYAYESSRVSSKLAATLTKCGATRLHHHVCQQFIYVRPCVGVAISRRSIFSRCVSMLLLRSPPLHHSCMHFLDAHVFVAFFVQTQQMCQPLNPFNDQVHASKHAHQLVLVTFCGSLHQSTIDK